MLQLWKDGTFKGANGKNYLVATLVYSSENEKNLCEPRISRIYFERLKNKIILNLETDGIIRQIKEEETHKWFISSETSPYRVSEKWSDIVPNNPVVEIDLNEGITEMSV